MDKECNKSVVTQLTRAHIGYIGLVVHLPSRPAALGPKSLLSQYSLVPRPYFFLLLSLFIHKSQERHSEAAKKEMGVQLRKSKAWFGKSRDPQGFL